jgi:hypothetical protein
MKITKRQLKRLIKEERSKLLKEFGAMDKEAMSPLIQFSQAWSGLGDAIQSQMIDLINGYIENREDVVYDINPNAFEQAQRRLQYPLMTLGESNPDAEEVIEAMEWAQGIMEREGVL